ncbi:MAG: hypothetical protein WC979_00525 [Candidatus Pacearchaeota archaeon]|jgi:hypothetical protein|nr:hypothetical protein [Clostridia bacterium]
MKRRIPTLNEFVTTTFGYDRLFTSMGDDIKKQSGLNTIDSVERPSSEIAAAAEMIANKLGEKFRNKPFQFVSDWKTYVNVDIEDSSKSNEFEEFLMNLGLQFNKESERLGYQILLTEPNIKIIQSI